MSRLRVILLGIVILLAGCSAQKAQTISRAQFVDYGDTPLSHTIYIGSDNGYHYFAWSHEKTSGRWKVPQEELIVANQFKLGEREAFLLKRPDGQWCAHPCE